jgi:hypothetical protein
LLELNFAAHGRQDHASRQAFSARIHPAVLGQTGASVTLDLTGKNALHS